MNKAFRNSDRPEIIEEHTSNSDSTKLVDSITTKLIKDASCIPASEQEIFRGVADLSKCFSVTTTYINYNYPPVEFHGPPSQTKVTENNVIGVNEECARQTFDALTM